MLGRKKRKIDAEVMPPPLTLDEVCGMPPSLPPPSPPPSPAPPPTTRQRSSFRLLFSPIQRRHAPLLIIGFLLSLSSGALPPIMTKVLGNAFDAYTSYEAASAASASAPSQGEKDKLLNAMVKVVWHLCVLAAATMVLSTTMISVWVAVGECVAFEWRKNVYIAVTQKKMDWFDLGMGCDGEEEESGNTQDIDASTMGSGGLMAKFARETDDIRMALSQQMGQLLQYGTTAFAALILALVVNWSLTLVILASIPFAAVITTIVEIQTGPQLTAERQLTAKASGVVERTVSAISTVKAFNAQQRQSANLQDLLQAGTRVYNKTAVWWGARLGVSTTIMFCMFVQGFWYGSHLVQTHKATPGDVMTVFWSSILVSGHIQQIIEGLNMLEKGKAGALGLHKIIMGGETGDDGPHGKMATLVTRQEDIPSSASTKVAFSSPTSPAFSIAEFKGPRKRSVIQPLQRIVPAYGCKGEISLRNVDFTYPAAAVNGTGDKKTLTNVDMYFPAGETTFIVGSSGSGKSTVAQLLLRLYRPDAGQIELDETDLRLLDSDWCRTHIASVDQHPIVFDLSVHDNVALGLTGRLSKDALVDGATHVPIVSRSRVIEACRTALLHDFIKDLPQGYDTVLGTRGATLSGGQKQRLSVARARLRDPTILILDEATSALDLTSRTLVHAAVKQWRRGRTTVIITHDLSQVDEGDFLYFMKDGAVVEHGYREELEKSPRGQVSTLAKQQRLESRQSKVKKEEEDEIERMAGDESGVAAVESPPPVYQSDWKVQRAVVVDTRQVQQDSATLVKPVPRSQVRPGSARGAAPFRYNNSSRSQRASQHHHARSRSDASINSYTSMSSTTSKYLKNDAEHSDVSGAKGLRTLHITQQWHANTVVQESPWLEAVAKVAEMRRQQSHGRLDVACSAVGPAQDRGSVSTASTSQSRTRRIWTQDELNGVYQAGVEDQPPSPAMVIDMPGSGVDESDSRLTRARLLPTLLFAIRTTPQKLFLALGLFVSLVGGAVTPLFSFFLAKLLATLSLPNQQAAILRYALAVLGLAFLEGISCFVRFTSMEMLGGYWVAHLRQTSFDKVLSQDRSWFDESSSSPQSLVTGIIKDAEDARNLIARSVGALLTVCAMVGVALIWSMCVGWQLTLVGAALAPLYIGILTVQSRIVAGYEARNKLRREEVAKRFYDMVSNIRGIRSMALEPVFAARFYDDIVRTKMDAIRSAPFRGFGFGLGEAMTYLAEALMFYVGAVLIVKGLYDFEKMVIVFNLIIFAVTFAGEILGYLPGLTQSLQATKDLRALYELPAKSDSQDKVPSPTPTGPICFQDVYFAYPSRPLAPVLNGLTLTINPGETVAIVGSSGCGKSTVAALLERLYDPSPEVGLGKITWGHQRLDSFALTKLRETLTLVSQTPDLFDMSIADNVAFGANRRDLTDKHDGPTREEVIAACKLSCAHDFIRKLPKGYDTNLGEGGSLLSGGQRQRIAIARALLRVLPRRADFANQRDFVPGKTTAKVLVLDEAASALDDTTRHALLDTLLVKDRQSRHYPITPPPVEVNPWMTYAALDDLTTILITHKLDEMKRCDRIIVLDAGRVVQQGTFEQLGAIRGGTFAKLASAGEWGA